MIANLTAIVALATAVGTAAAPAVELRPATLDSFQRYVRVQEQRIATEESSARTFLAVDPDLERALHRGAITVQKEQGSPVHIEGGLIHHWTGLAFVPGTNLRHVEAFMRDYPHLARYYQPEVMESRLIANNGQNFQVALKLRKHEVFTVVLDTVSDVQYGALDPSHQWSASHMDHISEEDGNHGFLWRMYTYWRFVQVPDGVYLECEVLTLTRDIPLGLGWAVKPFISSVPKESLTFTLQKTRDGILAAQKLGGEGSQ